MSQSGHMARGLLAMSGSAVMFAVMSAIIRAATNLDAYRMAFYRFAVGLAVLGTLVLAGRVRLEGRRVFLLFARGALGAVAVLLYYVSIVYIGVARGTALSYTFPMFAAIFGAWFLKERVGPLRVLLILLSCAGIYLITTSGGEAARMSAYDGLALLGAASAGLAIVVVRKLRVDHSPFVIYLAQCGVGFWIMLIPANVSAVELGISGGVILLTIGLTATAGQLLMTYAYRHLTIVAGSMLSMLTPVLTAVIGIAVFRETVGGRGVMGIALVIAGCVAISAIPRRPITRPD